MLCHKSSTANPCLLSGIGPLMHQLRLSCCCSLSCSRVYGKQTQVTNVQGADAQKYEPVTDQARLLTCIEGYLAEYNQQSKTRMNLVLFLYAAEHICRISRIIKQPFGNALLVGSPTLTSDALSAGSLSEKVDFDSDAGFARKCRFRQLCLPWRQRLIQTMTPAQHWNSYAMCSACLQLKRFAFQETSRFCMQVSSEISEVHNVMHGSLAWHNICSSSMTILPCKPAACLAACKLIKYDRRFVAGWSWRQRSAKSDQNCHLHGRVLAFHHRDQQELWRE